MADRPKVARPRRGEVYLVSFDPMPGAEIKWTWPALVLQNEVANRFSPITIVAAITTQFDATPCPTEVLIRAPGGGVEMDLVVLLNQIRSNDRCRLARRLGRVGAETMARVDRALMLSLGLADL